MRVHHINGGTFCPLGGKLMDGTSGWPESAKLVCHCLMETGDGLVLIDTGLG